jgi:hypothetical protein
MFGDDKPNFPHDPLKGLAHEARIPGSHLAVAAGLSGQRLGVEPQNGQDRGVVRVGQGLGFSTPDDAGNWTGSAVTFAGDCGRGLNDATKIKPAAVGQGHFTTLIRRNRRTVAQHHLMVSHDTSLR